MREKLQYVRMKDSNDRVYRICTATDTALVLMIVQGDNVGEYLAVSPEEVVPYEQYEARDV